MSASGGTPASPYVMLPSDEWLLVPLPWHASTHPSTPDAAPQTALHHPAAVATWPAEQSGAHLWRPHFLIASHADSIRHDQLVVAAVRNEKCTHGCIGRHLASAHQPVNQ